MAHIVKFAAGDYDEQVTDEQIHMLNEQFTEDFGSDMVLELIDTTDTMMSKRKTDRKNPFQKRKLPSSSSSTPAFPPSTEFTISSNNGDGKMVKEKLSWHDGDDLFGDSASINNLDKLMGMDAKVFNKEILSEFTDLDPFDLVEPVTPDDLEELRGIDADEFDQEVLALFGTDEIRRQYAVDKEIAAMIVPENDRKKTKYVAKRLAEVVNGQTLLLTTVLHPTWCLESYLVPNGPTKSPQISFIKNYPEQKKYRLPRIQSMLNYGNASWLVDPLFTCALETSHLCHNPRCCRQSHVVFETNADNYARRVCDQMFKIDPNHVCTHHSPPCIRSEKTFVSKKPISKRKAAAMLDSKNTPDSKHHQDDETFLPTPPPPPSSSSPLPKKKKMVAFNEEVRLYQYYAPSPITESIIDKQQDN
jgi:hypothetical protein